MWDHPADMWDPSRWPVDPSCGTRYTDKWDPSCGTRYTDKWDHSRWPVDPSCGPRYTNKWDPSSWHMGPASLTYGTRYVGQASPADIWDPLSTQLKWQLNKQKPWQRDSNTRPRASSDAELTTGPPNLWWLTSTSTLFIMLRIVGLGLLGTRPPLFFFPFNIFMCGLGLGPSRIKGRIPSYCTKHVFGPNENRKITGFSLYLSKKEVSHYGKI